MEAGHRATEQRDRYTPAAVRPQRSAEHTRCHHMHRLLWASLTHSYLQRQRRLADQQRAQTTINRTSEYTGHYNRPATDHTVADVALQRAYPLYGAAAVTVWCPQLVNRSPFKRGSNGCFTKPLAECYNEQFQ